MMLAHLVLSGDVAQRREWQDQIEAIHQAKAIDAEPSYERKRLLARDRIWRSMRRNGRIGALYNLSLSTAWLALLIPSYAVFQGFGWPAALAFLLPVPIAWKASRKLFERATLETAVDTNDRSLTLVQKLGLLPRASLRTFSAGFAFGAVLLLLQGLISVFMTPAPTIMQEIYWDALYALVAGTVSGTASMALAPLLAQLGYHPPK
jgi:hypothetical protein